MSAAGPLPRRSLPSGGPARSAVGGHMSEATKIRARLQGERTLVRLLVAHEMESGQRKDAAGKPIPAWFIQEFALRLNGRPVLSAQWGTAMSKNPFVEFTLRGARAGDKIVVTWRDNRGDSRTDEAVVA
jgi:sulfur-oxidizing protein SoxZ